MAEVPHMERAVVVADEPSALGLACTDLVAKDCQPAEVDQGTLLGADRAVVARRLVHSSPTGYLLDLAHQGARAVVGAALHFQPAVCLAAAVAAAQVMPHTVAVADCGGLLG